MNTNGTLHPGPKERAGGIDHAELRRREDEAFSNAVGKVRDTPLEDLFSIKWLQMFHREIFGGLRGHAGVFRDEPIRVAWHIPQAQTRSEVENYMEQYIADCRRRLALALLKPEAIPALVGYAFWKLTYIAPFADGNGRVANGLSILLQRYFDLPGVSLYDRAEPNEYAAFLYTLRSYDNGNAAPFFEHLRKRLGLEDTV